MENLLLLIPLIVTVGHCAVSACMFRKLSSRIVSLEEKILVISLPSYPPPPSPVLQQSSYYNAPPGYGQPYTYPGGQGNLNAV
jgi:hypothetical protein